MKLRDYAPDELSTDEAKRLLDDLAGWHVGLLIMDGGEPLTREDFLELASYASKRGLRVVVGSNGSIQSPTESLRSLRRHEESYLI